MIAKTVHRVVVVVLAACALVAIDRHAASATTIFLSCPGLPATSTSIANRDAVDVQTFEAGGAAATSATITKAQDGSSSVLRKAGASFPSCTVRLFRAVSERNAKPYTTYKLDNVTVLDYVLTVGAAGTTEKIRLGFSRMVSIDTTCDNTGRCGTPSPVPQSPSPQPSASAARPSAQPSMSPIPKPTSTPAFHPRLPGQSGLATPTPRPY